MKDSQYKILIVDDEKPVRDVIAGILSAKEHVCETATDGAEALDKFTNSKFDVVITDIVMPEMDGFTLISKLLEKEPFLPILATTGYAQDYSLNDCIIAGASDFVVKPFTHDEFCARFNRMMRDHQIRIEIRDKQRELARIKASMLSEYKTLSGEKEETVE